MEIKEAYETDPFLLDGLLLHELRINKMLSEVALDGDFRDDVGNILLLMAKTRLAYVEQIEKSAIEEFSKAERIYEELENGTRRITPPRGISGKGTRKPSPYANPYVVVSHHITNGNALMDIARRCRYEISLLILGRFILPLH